MLCPGRFILVESVSNGLNFSQGVKKNGEPLKTWLLHCYEARWIYIFEAFCTIVLPCNISLFFAQSNFALERSFYSTLHFLLSKLKTFISSIFSWCRRHFGEKFMHKSCLMLQIASITWIKSTSYDLSSLIFDCSPFHKNGLLWYILKNIIAFAWHLVHKN